MRVRNRTEAIGAILPRPGCVRIQPWDRPIRASVVLLSAFFLAAAFPLLAREKDKTSYGEGLIVNIPLAAAEVERVVEDIAQNGIIRGTKEYNKDEYVEGAKESSSPRVFPAWTADGKVFYKVREQALDPRNFKDSGDVGTLVVRYVVVAQGNKNTVLRIDALFQEDFRHTVHQSNGSVESAEYKDIQEHLEAVELIKKETVEEQRQKLARKKNSAIPGDDGSSPSPFPQSSSVQAPMPDTAENSATPEPEQPSLSTTQPPPGQSLEDRVKDLRRQVSRLVKAPGAPLKSAPFHTASTLQTLSAGTEILILISTPYWYGVETHEGQHGWIMRDQLEQQP